MMIDGRYMTSEQINEQIDSVLKGENVILFDELSDSAKEIFGKLNE